MELQTFIDRACGTCCYCHMHHHHDEEYLRMSTYNEAEMRVGYAM